MNRKFKKDEAIIAVTGLKERKKSYLLRFAAVFFLFAVSLNGQEISQIDKNFGSATVDGLSVNYFDALKKPFEINGFAWRKNNGPLNRLPEHLTEKDVNKGVLALAKHTSGGTIRFKSDSPYLTIRADYVSFYDMNNMPRTGSGGFDLYTLGDDGRELYLTTIQPKAVNRSKTLEQRFSNVADGKMRGYTLYLPLYSGVKNLEIGVKPGSRILPPEPQKIRKAILFYGSSITQGGCASRPANNYTTMLCRAVDAPQINLGFSGSSKGEPAIAKEIAKLDLAAFVMAYQYNVGSSFLKKTHQAFFKAVRAGNPDLPIIILSGCSRIDKERKAIVRKTYDEAVAAGDKKVWYIDGSELFGEAGGNMCTVDGIHPNDLGFYMMYRRILPVLREALGNGK